MRFHSPLAAVLLCLSSFLSAQPILVDGDVCLDIEVVAIHTEGELAGMTTYRLYATLPGPADVVTTVFGDLENPTSLQTTTNFYQSELGGQFPCANNPILFDAFPELEWDSWLTIGVDGPPDPTAGEDCPQVVMSTGSPFMTEFENGNSFSIDDLIGSAWFVVPTFTNGLPDEDGRVLLGQVTTDGELSGVFYMQVLPGGIGSLAEVVELPFYGACDEISPALCPTGIFAVDNGCEWGFEVSNFQPGEAATWTFGDDFVNGGHYAEYTFAGDGIYPVTVSFTSDYCPEGVTLETLVEVEGCSEPECNLELVVETVDSGQVIMVIPTGYPEGVELIYALNGEVFQEGGLAATLPFGIGENPWQVCVQYISDDCPEGVVACTGSEDYENGCPQEIWVGGAGCEYVLSICDYTPGEEVYWLFSDGTSAEGHFTWHTFPEDGEYQAIAYYVSPTCPDTVELSTQVIVEGCGPCALEIVVADGSPEAGFWLLEAEGAPEGAVIEWFNEEGAVISDSPELYFEGSGTVCAAYETPDCPLGVEVCIELEVAAPDCEVQLELTELGLCGQYLAEYEGEPGPGDVEWFIDGVLMQSGGGAFDFSVDSAEVATLCVVATGEACPEGEEVCIEVENAGCDPCLTEEEAELMSWPVDEEAPCLVSLLLEMMQPDGYSIFWEFGDGITTTNAYLWTEHQYAESGTYEVCATVFSPGCPEGATWCIEVVVEGCDSDCEPVVVTVEPNGASGFYFWTGYGDEWSEDDMFSIPGGSAEPLELGLCLTDGCYVMDFAGSADSDPAGDLIISVSDEDGWIEWENPPFVDENGWQVIQFGVGEVGCDLDPELCTLEIEAVQEADGSWTLTAVTESDEDVDFLWVLSDGSALNGATVNHTFVDGVTYFTACVSALFPECEEVLSACIDLENGSSDDCVEVEVELEGETLEGLLTDLEMVWNLLGDGIDLSGLAVLDPEQEGLDGLVFCLPSGCYSMTFDLSGIPGFQGLPGMTLSVSVGEEDEIEVDLSVLNDVLSLDFGVLADCGNAVASGWSALDDGLRIYPNPAGWDAWVSMDRGGFQGVADWSLLDGMGRMTASGSSVEGHWKLPLSDLSPGGYVLLVKRGDAVLRKRVMVAR